MLFFFFFFFQAEDGIRDYKVTGVQTCALPICAAVRHPIDRSLGQIFESCPALATYSPFHSPACFEACGPRLSCWCPPWSAAAQAACPPRSIAPSLQPWKPRKARHWGLWFSNCGLDRKSTRLNSSHLVIS